MIQTQAMKFAPIVVPAAILDDASATVITLDTLGAEQLDLAVVLGATDIAMVALKLQECETSGGAYADCDGFVYGTSINSDGNTSSLPSANDDGKLFGFSVDLRKRMRYIKLVATAGNGSAGTYLAAVGVLSRMATSPSDAAGRGFAQQLIG